MSDVPDIHVLIYVHDEHFRKKLNSFLSMEKFHVHECKSEEEVIQFVDSERQIDVAVIDILPSENTGFRCLEYVKSNRNTVEAVMLNNHDQIHLSIHGMRLGAFDEIMFPFDMKRLKEKILKAYYFGQETQR